jgi:hypothetical protein
VELSGTGRGDVSARITLGDFEAEVRVQAGQDRALGADGQLRTCCTLSLEAEARLLSLGRAERVVNHVTLVGGLIGAAGLSVLCFLLLKFLAKLWGYVVFPSALVIAVPLGGAVLGGALGAVVGKFIGRLMASRAEKSETSVAATQDWNAFITEADNYLGTITPEA